MTDKKNDLNIEQKTDEITLKELIFKVNEYYFEIKNNWKLVLALVFIFLFYMGYKSFVSKPKYTASLTFMLNTNEGGGLSGIGGLLGQFGIGNKGEYSKEKIMSLNKSRRIIEEAIFEKATINNNTDYLANHLINNLDSINKWANIKWYLKPFSKPHSLKEFRFKTDSIEGFDNDSKKGLVTIYSHIAGNPKLGVNGIMSNGFDLESGIMHISIGTNNPHLSIDLTNSIFDKLSEFYVDKTIEKQKVTYDILKGKADSLLYLLEKNEIDLAIFEDRNQLTYNRKSKLRGDVLRRNVQKLSIMYGEVIKNLEIADFSLRNKTPFVQAIDRPKMPINGEKSSIIRSSIISIFLGLFFSSIFIITRKIFRDAMSE